MSKSTNNYQSGTHRATGGPTPQGQSHHTTLARKAVSDERFEGATGASPHTSAASVPSQPSRRDHRRTDNEPNPTAPGALTDYRDRAGRRDTRQLDVEQSRTGQVSPLFVIHSGPSSQRPLMHTTHRAMLHIKYPLLIHLTYLLQEMLVLRSVVE